MDGIQLVMMNFMKMMGIDPAQIEALKEEIPKLRAAIPAFATAVDQKMQLIDQRLEHIQDSQTLIISQLELIHSKVDPDRASQTPPPDPLAALQPIGGPAQAAHEASTTGDGKLVEESKKN